MKIKTLIFNWYATPENGEDLQKATVGELYAEAIVTNIVARKSQSGSGGYYYDVHLENNQMFRVFNPNAVLHVPVETPEMS